MGYPNKFKQGFIDRVEKKLKDCEIIYNPNTKGIWFINREERYWYLEYKIETNYLWWRYEFFNQLKELFCIPNEVFDEIISEWVENKLNCKVLSTSKGDGLKNYLAEETLNCKVLSTHWVAQTLRIRVEETLNCKVLSTNYYDNQLTKGVEETLNIKVNKVDWGLSQHLNIEDTLNLK
jgi:hypothetical protein